MLAPSSPLQRVPSYQSNGVRGTSPTHQFLDVPHTKSLRRSVSPTPGEPHKLDNKTKKPKGKSQFSMFRLQRHKSNSKKSEKRRKEEMSLSSSAGSVLLREKKQAAHNRRSFSGPTDRPDSPADSVGSFQVDSYSEGDSEDELLKILTNPSGGHSHTPSPLLRTPTPYQKSGSVESDGQAGGDNLSISPSMLEGANLVSG